MGKTRRIITVIGAVLTIALAILLLLLPHDGYKIVAGVLALSLMVKGIARVVYYFGMARNMVDGHSLLYTGILLFDVGLFAFTLSDIPLIYVMFYLISLHAVNGGIGVVRAMEKKNLDDPTWLRQMIAGVFGLAIALICFVFIRSGVVAIYIYSFGLIVNAIGRIATAFRRTAIVHIA